MAPTLKNSDTRNYYKQSYTKDEWDEIVNKCSLKYNYLNNSNINSHYIYENGLSTKSTFSEPSVPKLLLNYFICMAYEESSIRMAKELGYIKNNKDIKDFTELYKIKERSRIKKLIKLGEISLAIEKINELFGIEVLEPKNVANSTKSFITIDEKNKNSEDDLHFKLLLLNLIEMIRNHNNKLKNNQTDSTESNNKDFILDLIEYAQNKLALKASSNEEYMKDLELVMTLLLFPMNETKSNNMKLPKVLNDYYSLSLRSKLADIVNRRLLKHIHPSIVKRDETLLRFPDLLVSKDSSILNSELSKHHEMLSVRSKESSKFQITTEKLSKNVDKPSSYLNSEIESTEHWGKTSELIRNQYSDIKSRDYNISEIQYEAKLIQLLKLWIWCENELHQSYIGVPSIESSI
ncbi:hypothetical protein Kpol_1041p25 [Vanderwaltozyma polyspora DSM 70294]|uniref:CTLH domain-containing protein n=1 Tax=Vanderwaltozyma polyspora (strain ATCC 22028 / DSM 70294 / BCRC 21397 / CBS 2163 / NBRC 10782 / NRRL Y-8283 / UCD 57-17) TaxID=436907 RepID=A7TL92_VANPO|nr:uncharacterized protein Kpol_1041p25 [Vanderwaltozyma polyspora DSM 70294]EDO16967.1 hypothetical protein Kpol_1041p25 [Vanderwaltozyma polyspora DSM 70294]